MKVYRYGLLEPSENGPLVSEQMSKSHKYRNVLTEIERERRDAVRQATSAYGDVLLLERAVADADALVEAALLTCKSERIETRKRSLSAESSSCLKAARLAKKQALNTLREYRHAIRGSKLLTATCDAINETASQKVRDARSDCGVYWGTYLLVEEAMQAARKAPMYDGAEPNNPRFVRWNGEGNIGVQLQNGLPVPALFGEDSRIRIGAVNERAWFSESRGERRRLSRTALMLRVGSEERKPVWAKWPMVMHRPLPKEGIVKRACVCLKRFGPHREWSLLLTVDDSGAAGHRQTGEGHVGIDIGWRQFEDRSIRVCAWRDASGAAGELRLPAILVTGFEKAEELRSLRDRLFNGARERLSEQLEGLSVPEWFSEAAKTLSQWKSQARLAGLARRWKASRFEGDSNAYGAVETWRYQDEHLWKWESGQRTKCLRHRKNIYRCFAADMAKRYAVAVIEDFDLSKMARHALTESEDSENLVSRGNRQLAAPSELVGAIKNRFPTVAMYPAAWTTRTCNVCGEVETFDAEAKLSHTCKNGHRWDQDDNAAANLVQFWIERPNDAQILGGARKKENTGPDGVLKESRWERARRGRSEKEDRMKSAEEAEGQESSEAGAGDPRKKIA